MSDTSHIPLVTAPKPADTEQGVGTIRFADLRSSQRLRHGK